MTIRCPICERQFRNQHGLQIHVGAIHEGHEKYYSTLVCEQCEEEFTLKDSRVDGRRFCGYECFREWRRAHDFKGPNHPAWKGGYDNFSYGPNWTEQREKALERDQYQCQLCGMHESEHHDRYNQSLHVHHLISINYFHPIDSEEGYENMNRVSNLVSLCYRCHSIWEGIPVRPILVS